ncbi:biotin/lipoyl-containing protein [Chitinibacter sp. ZOR0017]|uniref:biotin/lipoyl-containing protein n=1 Tax=Chitinibacter sp. ZOR0017 TaxID=1339254 RepID=UPI0009E0418F|nr:biotin/lipoyl-containing protein [Chitinibacter sp. ZOR0017]
MTMRYTTHLICAPELPEAAEVAVFHVKPGQQVAADTRLITLLAADQEWPVLAPEAGQVSSLMVEYGDFVNSNDLLLMMEIAELPTGDLLLPADEPDSAQSAAPTSPSLLAVSPAAATLAAKLGLDLSQLQGVAVIDEVAVYAFARQELALLARLRQLLLRP